MQLVSLKMDPDEKVRLQELARERNVTLSWAFREGARLLLEDARENFDNVARRTP